jgi:hypothetical protein
LLPYNFRDAQALECIGQAHRPSFGRSSRFDMGCMGSEQTRKTRTGSEANSVLGEGQDRNSLRRQALAQARARMRYEPESSLSIHKVHCGDCVTLMDKMPAGSVGLIVASPAYNLLHSTGNGMKDGFGGKWENAQLANGCDSHNDAMPQDEYLKWQRGCLTAMMQVLREDGAIFYNHKWRVQDGLLQDRSDIVKGFPVRQITIWQRAGGRISTPAISFRRMKSFTESANRTSNWLREPPQSAMFGKSRRNPTTLTRLRFPWNWRGVTSNPLPLRSC